jgi:hypothetical protein
MGPPGLMVSGASYLHQGPLHPHLDLLHHHHNHLHHHRHRLRSYLLDLDSLHFLPL